MPVSNKNHPYFLVIFFLVFLYFALPSVAVIVFLFFFYDIASTVSAGQQRPNFSRRAQQ